MLEANNLGFNLDVSNSNFVGFSNFSAVIAGFLATSLTSLASLLFVVVFLAVVLGDLAFSVDVVFVVVFALAVDFDVAGFLAAVEVVFFVLEVDFVSAGFLAAEK